MLRHKIKQWFFEAVALSNADPELKRTLQKGHPNLEGFLDRVTKEITEAEKVCQSRKITITEKTLQGYVYDLTNFFIKGFEGEAKRRYESDIERMAREAQAAQSKEFDEVLAGNLTDEFKEAGLITNEEIDKRQDFQVAAQT